jgi:hypothetical protein
MYDGCVIEITSVVFSYNYTFPYVFLYYVNAYLKVHGARCPALASRSLYHAGMMGGDITQILI